MELDFKTYRVSWKMERDKKTKESIEVGLIKPSIELAHGAITHFHLIYKNRDEWKLLLMGEHCGDMEYGQLFQFCNLFEGPRTECVARALRFLEARQKKLERELDNVD